MCEFKVFLEGKKIFEDAIFCQVKGGELLLKDILGQTKQLSKCHITEVNVTAEKLVIDYD